MVLTKARDATLWHPQTHRFRLDSDRCLPLTFERYLRAEVELRSRRALLPHGVVEYRALVRLLRSAHTLAVILALLVSAL